METAPPPDLPRLHISGLPPTFPTPTLLTLFSSFGTPSHLSRHPARPFAHVSLTPHSPSHLTRCLTTLRSVIWNGAQLSVREAKEHYALRLRREWAEKEDDEEEEVVEHVHEPVRFRAEGKHVKFDDDLEDGADDSIIKLTYDEEDEGIDALDVEMTDVVRTDDTSTRPKTVAGGKTAMVASTLQLFGIADSAAVVTQSGQGDAEESSRPLKRVRRKEVPDLPEESEEGIVDLEREKQAALSVFAGMFGRKVRTEEEVVAMCRRKGLFRKLPEVEALTREADKLAAVAIRGRDKGKKIKRQPSTSQKSPVQPAVTAGDKNQDIHIPASSNFRRLALYRKLAPPLLPNNVS